MDTQTVKSLKICVVGGGAAGLAVAKIVKDSTEYKAGQWSIYIFEEREDIGGTWLPAPAPDKNIPPPTPMYDSIVTNLPHPIMCFPSFWFPPGTPLFPKAEVVEEYLRAYAREFDLMRHVRLNTSVTSTVWTGARWRVRTLTRNSGQEEEAEYDRLVIANGHYRVPNFPRILDLDSWRAAGRVTHSAWYRKPVPVGDKVLVVGGGFSGIDIAEEMSTVCKHLVHAAPHSIAESKGKIVVRNARVRGLSNLDTDRNTHTAYFEDGSSEEGIDHIFLATGYTLSFPFLSSPLLLSTPPSYPPTPNDPLPEHLHNDGRHIFPLTRLLFPIVKDLPPTALAFIGLPVKVAPFPVFEAQARALAHVFADPSALSIPDEVSAIHARLASLRSDPELIGSDSDSEKDKDKDKDADAAISRAWHMFKGREQFDYRDALHAFAAYEAPGEAPVPEWCVEVYANMIDLRKVWKEIVERGEEERWVRGVGEKGEYEWVEVLQRLLEMVREKEKAGEGKVDVEPEAVV